MRIAVNALAGWSLAAALQVALPLAPVSAQPVSDQPVSEQEALVGGAADAEGAGTDAAGSEKRPGADRWVPSLAVISGATIQNWGGAALGILEPGPTAMDPNPRAEFMRFPVDGKDRDVAPYVGANFELMTPELPIPTSPRVFIGGDITWSFGTERAIAREGDPNLPRPPVPPGTDPASITYEQTDVLGQGSKTFARLEQMMFGAHIGVAFPFELFGRQLRIKPSFAWLRYSVDIGGLMVDVQCFDPGFPPFFPPTAQCNGPNSSQRDVILRDKAVRSFNGIGPGLDLEMDTFRWGPIGTSIFVGGRIYSVLGPREVQLGAVRSFSDPIGVGDRTTADWSFTVDQWMYRVGLGLRLHWLGSVPGVR